MQNAPKSVCILRSGLEPGLVHPGPLWRVAGPRNHPTEPPQQSERATVAPGCPSPQAGHKSRSQNTYAFWSILHRSTKKITIWSAAKISAAIALEFNDRWGESILARMAGILAILSVSRECIGILNIFYKKVFRSTPLRRGETSILRSREPVKSQIRSVSVLYLYCIYCIYCTVTVLYLYCIPIGSGISQGHATLKSMYLRV